MRAAHGWSVGADQHGAGVTGSAPLLRCTVCGNAAPWRTGAVEAVPGGWSLVHAEDTPRCTACQPLTSEERASGHAPTSCLDCGDRLHRAALVVPDARASWRVDVLLPDTWCQRCEARADVSF